MKLYGFWRSLATYRVRVALALKGTGRVAFSGPIAELRGNEALIAQHLGVV